MSIFDQIEGGVTPSVKSKKLPANLPPRGSIFDVIEAGGATPAEKTQARPRHGATDNFTPTKKVQPKKPLGIVPRIGLGAMKAARWATEPGHGVTKGQVGALGLGAAEEIARMTLLAASGGGPATPPNPQLLKPTAEGIFKGREARVAALPPREKGFYEFGAFTGPALAGSPVAGLLPKAAGGALRALTAGVASGTTAALVRGEQNPVAIAREAGETGLTFVAFEQAGKLVWRVVKGPLTEAFRGVRQVPITPKIRTAAQQAPPLDLIQPSPLRLGKPQEAGVVEPVGPQVVPAPLSKPPVARRKAVQKVAGAKRQGKAVADQFAEGLKARSILEGGEVDFRKPAHVAAWRAMGPAEFDALMKGAELGGPSKAGRKGGWFSWFPARASQQKGAKGRPKFLVEFKGVQTEGEASSRPVTREDVSGVWRSEGGEWVRTDLPEKPSAGAKVPPKAEPSPPAPVALSSEQGKGPGEGKQPWEMTRAEYRQGVLDGRIDSPAGTPEGRRLSDSVNALSNARARGLDVTDTGPYDRALEEAIIANHRGEVASARAMGRPVPPEVLAEDPYFSKGVIPKPAPPAARGKQPTEVSTEVVAEAHRLFETKDTTTLTKLVLGKVPFHTLDQGRFREGRFVIVIPTDRVSEVKARLGPRGLRYAGSFETPDGKTELHITPVDVTVWRKVSPAKPAPAAKGEGPNAGAVAIPDVTETAAAQGLAKVADDIKAVFSPASRGKPAGETANIVRQRTAELAQKKERAAKALEGARKVAPSLSTEEGLKFTDAIEAGQQHPNPAMQGIADQLRPLLDGRRDIIRGMGKGKLEHFIENYLPHIWEQPGKGNVLARVFGRRPLEGSKAFLRKRTIPTIREGIDLGLKPAFDNPVDMVLAKVHEMDRYIMGQTILKDLRKAGYAKFVRSTRKGPDGWVKIDDRVAEGRGPLVMDELTKQLVVTIRGHYYAPEPAARVLNNYLSPGLRGKSFFELARGTGNLMNQVQLGMSAFHLMFTTVDATTSKVALAIEQGSRGQIIASTKSLLSVPTAPISNVLRGIKGKNAYYGRASSVADEAVTQALVKGGYRYRMDRFWGGTQAGAFLDAVKASAEHYKAGRHGVGAERAVEAVLRAVPAAVETMARPIMEVVVPLQKAGVAYDLARLEMERLGPNATEAQVRAAMAKVVDSVDNRMGQLVYDNLFWNRTLKDLGMVSVRSLGWNIGTFRELLGGIADVPGTIGRIAKGEPAVTHRMAYVLALPVTVGALGATLQYLRTGKGPQELKDYFFPKTGDILPNGRPERVAFASYMKDVYAYSKHPVTTLSHKVHPLVNMTLELLANEDFYGTEIRHQDDPLVKQLGQVFDYASRTFQPFSVRNYKQMRESGEGRAKAVQSFFGIVPAPATVAQTKAEEMMSGFLRENLPVGARTREEADRGRVVARTTALVRAKKPVHLSPQEKTLLRDRDVDRIAREASEPALVVRFKRLRLDQAGKVWLAANPTERKLLEPVLVDKLSRAEPDQAQRVIRFIRAHSSP